MLGSRRPDGTMTVSRPTSQSDQYFLGDRRGLTLASLLIYGRWRLAKLGSFMALARIPWTETVGVAIVRVPVLVCSVSGVTIGNHALELAA